LSLFGPWRAYIILTNESKLVCSGLDKTCYNVPSHIALQVSYFSEYLNKHLTIELKTTVLKFSPIDLVIGRESIRKYNLFSKIPCQLAAPPTVCSVDSFANSTCRKTTSTPCGSQPKRRTLLQDGSPKGRFASQQSDLATSQTRGVLGALVDKSDNLLNRAAADVDEIDPASSDTFLPWSPEFFDADPL
jgi:hypothetical protein